MAETHAPVSEWLSKHPCAAGLIVGLLTGLGISVVIAAIVFLVCGCSLRHGWAPSNYRSHPLPPDRIECWQPGEHWTEQGQACHDVRGERDGNKELR